MANLVQFKQCPNCELWFSIDDIIENPSISMIGMRICESDPELSLYYFFHNSPECQTTFAIPVQQMRSFIIKQIPLKLQTGSLDCELRCVDLFDTEVCSQKCRNAPYRELLNKMKENKKVTTET